MPKRTRKFQTWVKEQLADPVKAAHYINAAVADSHEMLLIALRNVAEAKKMSRVADEAQVNRETLYRTLSKEGNPTLDTLNSVLDAVGLSLRVEAKGTVEATFTESDAMDTRGMASGDTKQGALGNVSSLQASGSGFCIFVLATNGDPVSSTYQENVLPDVPPAWIIAEKSKNDCLIAE